MLLKVLKLPTAEELESSLSETQAWAKDASYREEDVDDIIKAVQQRRHARKSS